MHVAIDFETYYDQDYSLRKMSTWNYVFDKERFDSYMVAVYSDDIHYVGHPKDFRWMKINGATLVMHNAHFDGLVVKRLQLDGVIPAEFKPAGLVDTADMASYLKVPRNLAGASQWLLNITMDKAPRAKMKGKTWKEAIECGMQEEMLRYGGKDAELSYKLWAEFNSKWPADEQRLSELSREACWAGLSVNEELVTKSLSSLKTQLWEAENAIPWTDSGAKPLSPKAIREECERNGMSCPSSFAETSEEAAAWEEKYSDEYPWINAVKNFRRINTLMKRVQAVSDGIREDGTFPYQIKYYGASTGRFSGGGDSGGKFNMQNMPRDAMFGVDLRPFFIAKAGHSLLICDYAQIEARILLWRVGDQLMLNRIRGGESIYEAHARMTMGWTGGKLKVEDPHTYSLAKARVLGLGYGCGAEKFKSLARIMCGLELEEIEAVDQVEGFRATNQGIVKLWIDHHRGLITSARHGHETHEIELLSGRSLVYFNPTTRVVPYTNKKTGEVYDRTEYFVRFSRGENLRKVYGGLLTENEIQATARDVLKDGWLALHEAGHDVRLTVHDEYVIQVPDEKIETAKAEITSILKSTSPWATGCPIDVEIVVSKHYLK